MLLPLPALTNKSKSQYLKRLRENSMVQDSEMPGFYIFLKQTERFAFCFVRD